MSTSSSDRLLVSCFVFMCFAAFDGNSSEAIISCIKRTDNNAFNRPMTGTTLAVQNMKLIQ